MAKKTRSGVKRRKADISRMNKELEFILNDRRVITDIRKRNAIETGKSFGTNRIITDPAKTLKDRGWVISGDTIHRKENKKFALGGIDPLSMGLSVVNMGVSAYNAAEAKKAQETSVKMQQQLAENQRYENDARFLDDFNTSGSNVSYYKDGGKFKLNARTTGNKSKFKPIGDGVFEMQGATHENGGINVGGSELEDNELVKFDKDGMKILSDNPEFFGYSPADNAKANPATFNSEFIKQEAMKSKTNNTRKFVLGGNAEEVSFGTMGVPNATGVPINEPNKYSPIPYVMDNVTNAMTTAMTPKVPVPTMIPGARLNTDIDVEPLVDRVKGGERGSMNYLNRNISDANVAAAMGVQVGNNATRSINTIRSDERNQEASLQNQEVQMNIGINAENTARINQFGQDNVIRRLGINSSINENMNNLSRDLIDIQDKKRFDKRDQQRMGIQLAMDTEGAMSELIKNGSFDTTILAPGFDINTLKGANRREGAKRLALNQMNQRSA